MPELWSLSIEMQFYFFGPLLLLLLGQKLQKFHNIALGTLLILAWIVLYRKFGIPILEPIPQFNQLRHFLLHIPFLLFGYMLAYTRPFFDKIWYKLVLNPRINSLIFWSLFAICFVSIWLIKVFYKDNSFDIIWFTFTQMFLVGTMILVCEQANTQTKKLNLTKLNFGNIINNFGLLTFPFLSCSS